MGRSAGRVSATGSTCWRAAPPSGGIGCCDPSGDSGACLTLRFGCVDWDLRTGRRHAVRGNAPAFAFFSMLTRARGAIERRRYFFLALTAVAAS